jgi:hypothetical protein
MHCRLIVHGLVCEMVHVHVDEGIPLVRQAAGRPQAVREGGLSSKVGFSCGPVYLGVVVLHTNNLHTYHTIPLLGFHWAATTQVLDGRRH